MTTLQEAMREFGTGRLHATAAAALAGRDEAAANNDHAWAALLNATLCAAVDEQAARRRQEAELFEHLAPCPVRIVGVIRPSEGG